MKILVKFPTRARREKFFKVLEMYRDMANNLDDIHFLITCDEDDKEMNNKKVKAALAKIPNLSVHFGQSKTKIEAVNADMDKAPGDWQILLLASDDMIPQEKGYDDIIRNKMLELYPDTDGVLFFNDGYRTDINTLTICGRHYYERFGYIYHPVYKTWYPDTEFMHVANFLKRQTFIDQVIIKHENPDNNSEVPKDELYHKNRMQGDKEIFKIRRSHNFFIKRLLIVQPGRFGDLIAILNMARMYSSVFKVDILCPKEYHGLFRNISYATPVEVDNDNYFRRIHLGFGFTQMEKPDGFLKRAKLKCASPEAWWQMTKTAWSSALEAKYHIGEVAYQYANWNIDFGRDRKREADLVELLQLPERFALVHEESHGKKFIEAQTDLPKVHFKPHGDFNIFDWLGVIEKATEIHCIDSSLSNFVERIYQANSTPKYLYETAREPERYYLRFPYKKNWIRK